MSIRFQPTAVLVAHVSRMRAFRLALAGWVTAILLPVAAGAATMSATATPFTGDALSVTIEIDDGADPGNLVITLSVDDDGNIGDLRGLFLNVTDETLLAGLSVSGSSAITSSVFSANSVMNLGGGSNLNGGGTPCPCDIGLEIGSPGIGKDDIQTVTFVLSHLTKDLKLSLFSNQSFGVRATSVGATYGSRAGSSKLVSVVPEPSSTMLMMLGFAGLSRLRRSKAV